MKCPKCKRVVSSYDTRCAYCGAVVSRPMFFWLGLLALVVGMGGTVGSLLVQASTKGVSPADPPASVGAFFVALTIVGIVLVVLSRRGCGWSFWVGGVLFPFGPAMVPTIIRVALDAEVYTTANGPLWVMIMTPLTVFGAFCLWKGWPGNDARRRRTEVLGFLGAMCLLCLMASLIIVGVLV